MHVVIQVLNTPFGGLSHTCLFQCSRRHNIFQSIKILLSRRNRHDVLDYKWFGGAAHRQLKCHCANHSTARHTLTEFDFVKVCANEETKFGRLHRKEKDQGPYWKQSYPGIFMRADKFEQQTTSTHASSWCLFPFGATRSQAGDTASIYQKI